VVRGNGTGSLRVDDLGAGPGAITVMVVSRAAAAGGPSWQRIIACYTGEGQEWVLPNWTIVRPGGAEPEAYGARLFTVQARARAEAATITVLGASAIDGQYLAGDVAEVLIFDRALRFDEFAALEHYLKAKWGLAN
jgi:hypothetical protein